MLEMQIIASGRPVPLFDLPAMLGRRGAAREVGDQIDALIAFMDDLGGDPDLEECGTEDSFLPHKPNGPGCPVSDSAGDISWPEWNTRGRHKLQWGGEPIYGMDGYVCYEDAEDDDSDHGIEDDRHDTDTDSETGSWPEGAQGAAHTIPDDDCEEEAVEAIARRPFRDMIRRVRCERITRAGRPWAEADGCEYVFRAPTRAIAIGVAADLIG